MTRLHARHALIGSAWQRDVTVEIGPDGRIAGIDSDGPADHHTGVLLPAPANLHSHAFQRAMAGLGETRGPKGHDSFWTWREIMYRFLQSLRPADVEAIAAQVQVETLEAGYAAIGEFHYLHHQPDGTPYDAIEEMSARVIAAADETGIGLTHLPVLYSQGGLDGRALAGGQLRFGNDLDRFAQLWAQAAEAMRALPEDSVLGVAPHSLRAVAAGALTGATEIAPSAPLHIHIAEQTAEVEEVEAATGQRPVAWLLDQMPVDARWCLIHATHMTPAETKAVARASAIAGLCPITESNLGDGIFDGVRFRGANGRFGVGSDSNVRIALAEELRTLEYSQRLRDRGRALLADETRSSGRALFEEVCLGGAAALGRQSGQIAVGQYADLLALDDQHLALTGLSGDALLDAWIFTADDRLVTDVWAAGRHMVRAGRHIHHDAVEARFRKVLSRLRDDL